MNLRTLSPTLGSVFLFGLMAWAGLSLPDPSIGLAREAHQSLGQSGVTNPVTAVLLNYRAYDTLLEIAVLLLTIMGVWSLRSVSPSAFGEPAGPVLSALLHWLSPLLLLTGGFLLWTGAFAPGGAFQGGALLGGMIVLMLLGGLLSKRMALSVNWLRTGLWIGLAVFICVGLGTMLFGSRFLEYGPANADTLILAIETAALLSIGLTLGALFFGGRPERPSDASLDREP